MPEAARPRARASFATIHASGNAYASQSPGGEAEDPQLGVAGALGGLPVQQSLHGVNPRGPASGMEQWPLAPSELLAVDWGSGAQHPATEWPSMDMVQQAQQDPMDWLPMDWLPDGQAQPPAGGFFSEGIHGSGMPDPGTGAGAPGHPGQSLTQWPSMAGQPPDDAGPAGRLVQGVADPRGRPPLESLLPAQTGLGAGPAGLQPLPGAQALAAAGPRDESRTVGNVLGSLDGREVEPACMRQLERLARSGAVAQRPGWQALLDCLAKGVLTPFPDNPPDGLLRFGYQEALPSGHHRIVGTHAQRQADGRMRLLNVLVQDGATQAAQGLNAEAEDVQARLRQLRQRAQAHGQGTAQAYVDTAQVLDAWMGNTGRGRVLDARGDVRPLLQAFRSHVGAQSYPGRNAEVVLHALAGGDAQVAPQARSQGLRGLSPIANPLGLNQAERQRIAKARGGQGTLAYLEEHWQALLGWISRNELLLVASNSGAKQAIEALQEEANTPLLMKRKDHGGLGMSLGQLLKVASNHGGKQAIEALKEEANTPLLMKPKDHGGLGMSLEQLLKIASNDGGKQAIEALKEEANTPLLMKPKDHGGLGMSLEQLLQVASRGGAKQAIEAMKELGRLLLQAGVSIDQITSIAAHDGGGPALRAVAARLPYVQQGLITLVDLVNAGSKHRRAAKAVLELQAA